MITGLAPVLWVGVRQRVRQIESLHGLQVVMVMVMMVDVYGTGAGPRGGGGGAGGGGTGEYPRPGVKGARQLHAAGVVAGKRGVSSRRGFSSALKGLCSGHLSGSLMGEDSSVSVLCSFSI